MFLSIFLFKAVSHLIAAVLKENVSSKKIRQASDQVCGILLLLSPLPSICAYIVQWFPIPRCIILINPRVEVT